MRNIGLLLALAIAFLAVVSQAQECGCGNGFAKIVLIDPNSGVIGWSGTEISDTAVVKIGEVTRTEKVEFIGTMESESISLGKLNISWNELFNITRLEIRRTDRPVYIARIDNDDVAFRKYYNIGTRNQEILYRENSFASKFQAKSKILNPDYISRGYYSASVISFMDEYNNMTRSA